MSPLRKVKNSDFQLFLPLPLKGKTENQNFIKVHLRGFRLKMTFRSRLKFKNF